MPDHCDPLYTDEQLAARGATLHDVVFVREEHDVGQLPWGGKVNVNRCRNCGQWTYTPKEN
jgi:hypothetical protein